MLIFKNKPLTVLVNIFLFIWQLPQVLIGVVMLAIFHNCTIYKNPNNGISVFNINCHNAFGYACFSTGPFIITCDDKVDEETRKHETGHSLDSLYMGPLFHLIISIPSICFYWYRKIKNKDSEWYYSCWTERRAERNGVTDRYLAKTGQ